jgi:hypothetical protein
LLLDNQPQGASSSPFPREGIEVRVTSEKVTFRAEKLASQEKLSTEFVNRYKIYKQIC